MEDLIKRPCLKKVIHDECSSDVEDKCFGSGQFIHVAESNERQPAAPTWPAGESEANVSDSKLEIGENQRVSKYLLEESIGGHHFDCPPVGDKVKTDDSSSRKKSILSEEEERISKSPPLRPPPTPKNNAADIAGLSRLSIRSDVSGNDEAEPHKRNKSDEDHIWLESTESRMSASAAPTRTPVTHIAVESDSGREEDPLRSCVIGEHIASSEPSRATLTSATDSLDVGEAGLLNTTRSWRIAAKAPSRSPPVALLQPEGFFPELTDSDFDSPLNRIIDGIDHNRFDELRETGRARRTNNPIYGQRESKDPPDLPEREASNGGTLESKETEKKKFGRKSHTARVLQSLRNLKRVGTKDTTHHSTKNLPGLQRNNSEDLIRRNLPARPALRRVAQSQRYLDRNLISGSKKAQKPPPLPSVESFPLSELDYRKSTPSLVRKISDALIVSRPRRQTSMPLLEFKTPNLPPRSDLVPPPPPLKDMRLPPLPNEPKLLIPKLYEDENETLGNENSRNNQSSQVSSQSIKPKQRRSSYSDPELEPESLKPKYYDANGQPVNVLIPITIW